MNIIGKKVIIVLKNNTRVEGVMTHMSSFTWGVKIKSNDDVFILKPEKNIILFRIINEGHSDNDVSSDESYEDSTNKDSEHEEKHNDFYDNNENHTYRNVNEEEIQFHLDGDQGCEEVESEEEDTFSKDISVDEKLKNIAELKHQMSIEENKKLISNLRSNHIANNTPVKYESPFFASKR